MSKIGIVTVLYNSEKVLDDFFRTLNAQTFKDFTLYVIDNASTDNGLEVARRLAETVSFKTVFFPEPENWGVAKGNNIGIRAALSDGCEFILLSNNDVVLESGTIQSLLDGITQIKSDMVVPKIYYYGTNKIWSFGGTYRYYKGMTVQYGQMEEDSDRFNDTLFCDYSPTCFMLIKADVFEKVGMMDEKYFVYFDDTDFVWRAVIQNSLKLAVIPNSKLWHKESVCTGGVMSDFAIKYLARNSWYFVLKNFKFPQKHLTVAYMWLRSLLWKPIRLSKNQYGILRAAEREGRKLYRSTRK